MDGRFYVKGQAMKKAVILGERQAALVDVPEPKAKEDWAVVKVHATPMCTEYKGFVGGHKSEFLGHEAIGEVVEVAQPCKVKVGDRVIFSAYGGDEFKLGERQLLLLREEDILAILS